MSTSGLGGGKKSANVELNLVPYIDLLSTLIVFLLLTAVWQQISSLSTNGQDTSSSQSAAVPDPNKVDLSVSVFVDRVEATAGKNLTKIPNIDGDPDYKTLLRVLDGWKAQWPARKDVTLNSDSQSPYKHMIRIMDTLVEADFDDVGVNTN